jgi:hypothetical protein
LGAAGGGNGTNVASTVGTGLSNTGGGGGGGGNQGIGGGAGGSGIVVIRYPSYLKQATSTTGSPTTYIAGPWRVYVFYASGTITF